jgi:hypothetical protein
MPLIHGRTEITEREHNERSTMNKENLVAENRELRQRLADAANELRALREYARWNARRSTDVVAAFYNGQRDALNTAVMIVAQPEVYRATRAIQVESPTD